ncbi:MAG: MAPEG family protein [Gammaproteobacteria bacterium]|nr:MAPEG family protein [Gammaproteobacteria bacterium]
MTIALWCVLVAGIMPYLFTGIAKSSRPGYNNRAPREFLSTLEGWGQRANWAQVNSFEAFPLFAVAVLAAQLRGAEQSVVDQLAMGFIAARLAYGAFYVFDRATLRSLAWTAGIGCAVALFIVH